MPDFPYLIVGGGMTAAAAVEGILEHEPGARIGLIGDEPHPLRKTRQGLAAK
jgi:3-phenylpropionate/trans-cinnamate dioxygenase ferredoxin reductase component